jgi:hypothetical protein
MDQYNSIVPFSKGKIQDLLDTIGITQFTSGTNWYQVLAGLVIQGGFIQTAANGATISFNTSFTKQVLGVFITTVGASPRQVAANTVTLNNFVLRYNSTGPRDFYWFAIGV